MAPDGYNCVPLHVSCLVMGIKGPMCTSTLLQLAGTRNETIEHMATLDLRDRLPRNDAFNVSLSTDELVEHKR